VSLAIGAARPSQILCALLFLGACRPAPSSVPQPASPPPTRVEVRSDHWEDLTIYLERDGVRSRLGTLGGNTSRVLKIPNDLLGHGGWVRLIAVETGRRDHARSEVFSIQTGGSATWRTGPGDTPTPVVVKPPV